jgi:hypothetical protein
LCSRQHRGRVPAAKHSLSAFGAIVILDFGHNLDFSVSFNLDLTSHYFNLYFPNSIRWGISFHMSIYCQYIFFGWVFVKFFGTSFNCIVSLLLSLKRSFYNLNNILLSDMPFANMLYKSVAFTLIFLIIFVQEKNLILKKSSLLILFFMDCAFGDISKSLTDFLLFCLLEVSQFLCLELIFVMCVRSVHRFLF